MITREEAAALRQENEELKRKLKELNEEEGEVIPFLDFVEENKMKEVNVQTDPRDSTLKQEDNIIK